ncbi:MAG: DUF418 domain-containing protein [Ilumatobacter sp.]|nr:DUF418 domain-containing protein [Ilumatobacter sp.]
MALRTTTTTSVAAGATRRLAGPDVVRGAALIGVVVMNYHGYLVIRGAGLGTGWLADLFDPWAGPLSTRFAATFVLVAGVGVTLLTRRSRSRADRTREMRWRLVRRGAVLYVGGLFLDEIWRGTIITYYGAMFVIAAVLFTLDSRWIVAIGTAAVGAGALVRVWIFWEVQDGRSPTWLTSPPTSARGLLFDVFVNGTHPLLPWLGFFCVGILLGRALSRPWWRPAALLVGGGLFVGAGVVSAAGRAWPSTDVRRLIVSTTPASRSPVYVASALGTALVAYAVLDWLANRSPAATDPLRRAGQLTLTLYLAHIVVFNFVVDWVGWVRPAGLGTSLGFALAFWVVGIAAGTWWQRRLGRGPAERVYRAIGG